MLHIILLILKIIGMILLAILGLLLLVLLTILLVPIRYRVSASHGEAFSLEGRVSWLLHLIQARVSHLEGIFHIRVSVFGFVLYDNLRPKAPKIKIKKKSAVRRKNVRNVKKKVATNNKKSESIIKDNKSDTISIVENNKISDNMDGSPEAKVKDELPETLRKYALYEAEDEEVRQEEISGRATKKKENTKQLEDKLMKENEYQSKKEDKISFFRKFIFKIKSIKEKIIAFFLGIKTKIIEWFNTLVNIKQKIGLIGDFIKDELNREGFQITYSSLKKLLKHILPTKLRSRIIFGTGDPCTTGQALGFMGILYSFYGDKVQIIPDFENTRFEGKHEARGRIRLITILIIVIKLILDKRFKLLKRNFLILKEAL